LDRRRKRKTKK